MHTFFIQSQRSAVNQGSNMPTISTIGYEGASTGDFDAALAGANIALVVDVRAVAVSRRQGFSKTALSQRLQENGVRYVHLRELGDPKPGREAAKAGKHGLFVKIYEEHLVSRGAQSALVSLVEVALETRIALLCFEADAKSCHRSIVAARVADATNLRINHLRIRRENALHDGYRKDCRFGEGLAAA